MVLCLPYEKVECCSVRWSWCLFVRCVVGDDHPPHPLFLVGRLSRTIAVPTLSSMKYPDIEALPTQKRGDRGPKMILTAPDKQVCPRNDV